MEFRRVLFRSRNEIMLMFDAVKTQMATFVNTVEARETERRNSTRWAIGVAVSAATVFATLVSVLVPFLIHPAH